MKHLTAADLRNTRDIPDGEIFAVHDFREKKSMYILTPSTKPEEWWCFAVKLKGYIYQSGWISEHDKLARQKGREAMRQVLMIKRAGWYATGEKKFDDLNLHKEDLFRCAYCRNETVEVKGPCPCRRVASGIAAR